MEYLNNILVFKYHVSKPRVSLSSKSAPDYEGLLLYPIGVCLIPAKSQKVV